MLPNSYLTELACDARRADYLREARADTLARQARLAVASPLLARIAKLLRARSTAPGLLAAPAGSDARARLQAA